jgi:hypothetical protein
MKTRDNMSAMIEGLQREQGLLSTTAASALQAAGGSRCLNINPSTNSQVVRAALVLPEVQYGGHCRRQPEN